MLIGSDPRARAVGDRYLVHSVARAMRLLMVVADGPSEGLSLSDLTRALGTSKSTALALARTLSGFDLLAEVRPGPRYTLGTALIRLGDLSRSHLPFGDIIRSVLADLAELTEMTARVAIWDAGYPVFVDRADGAGSVGFDRTLGRREVAHASSVGKAILATMTAPQVGEVCARTGLTAQTARTITDLNSLLDDLAAVRARGFAIDDEESAEGVLCVGGAFFGPDGECAGAISLTGPRAGVPTWRISELGRTLRRHADRLSDLLGGPRYADLAGLTGPA